MPGGDELGHRLLDDYLTRMGDGDPWWAVSARPLELAVCVPTEPWRTRVDDLAVDMAQDVLVGVDEALVRIVAAGEKVDRALLVELSADLNRASDLVRCWFAVMAWGAGSRNRARLRQWTRALRSEAMVEALTSSCSLLRANRHEEAYRALRLPGVGQSYLTKWLWAIGLTRPSLHPRPYVLDRRIWQSLRLMQWTPAGRNEAERWIDYCRTLDRWGEALTADHAGWVVDGERIEQLLFELLRLGCPSQLSEGRPSARAFAASLG